ncbi:hypothetical protein MUK42_30778 [Musa troglodytarum]|uniref:Uncharacterized protein n=1 Tax=Musa troglodytarum TaxID=320322 RepID=A0A9E7G0E6_9LILI|nr:hypothetical protein MUK42_30778 [Musa troglodytarum]
MEQSECRGEEAAEGSMASPPALAIDVSLSNTHPVKQKDSGTQEKRLLQNGPRFMFPTYMTSIGKAREVWAWQGTAAIHE